MRAFHSTYAGMKYVRPGRKTKQNQNQKQKQKQKQNNNNNNNNKKTLTDSSVVRVKNIMISPCR